MKVTDTKPIIQVMPIESVHRTEENKFIASIKKIINLCKSALNLPSHHKFESIEAKNPPISFNSCKSISDDLLPPSKYKTNDEIKAMEPRIEQQQRAKTIEKQNSSAINNYVGIAYEDRLKYQQINEIGTAILSHPDYIHEEGSFRVSGNEKKTIALLKHLAEKKSTTTNSIFIKENNIGIPELVSAYKKLVANVLDGSKSEVKTLSTHFQKYSSAKNSDSLRPLNQQPLVLQIAIPLLAEISHNQKNNLMTPENLSIAFAPTISRAPNTSINSNDIGALLKLTQALQNYVTTLIQRETNKY